MFNRRGFTYTELMMVVVVGAILFVSAMGGADDTASIQADEFSLRFDGDVKYASSLSIAQPIDPAVIKVDPTNDRYWLARSSAPDTPIAHPRNGRPYVVQCGATGGKTLNRVDIIAASFGSDLMLKFDAFGGTDQPDMARLQIRAGARDLELSVSPVKAKTNTQQSFTAGLTADAGGVLSGNSTTGLDVINQGGTVGNSANAPGQTGQAGQSGGSGGPVEELLGGLGL